MAGISKACANPGNGPALALGHGVMRATAVATALTMLSACSFIGARGPAADRRFGEAPDCKSSSGSVAVDGLVGITAGAVGLSGSDGVDVVGGVLAAVYLGSAIYGYSATKRCDRARATYDDELVQIERDEEREEKRKSAAAWAAANRPAPAVAPPPKVAPPPTAPPRPVPPPPTVAATAADEDDDGAGMDVDPFAPGAGARPQARGATDDDDADDDAVDPDRWREFWRRLP